MIVAEIGVRHVEAGSVLVSDANGRYRSSHPIGEWLRFDGRSAPTILFRSKDCQSRFMCCSASSKFKVCEYLCSPGVSSFGGHRHILERQSAVDAFNGLPVPDRVVNESLRLHGSHGDVAPTRQPRERHPARLSCSCTRVAGLSVV